MTGRADDLVLDQADLVAEIRATRPWVLWLGAAVSIAEPAAAPMAGPVRAALLRLLAGEGEGPPARDDPARAAVDRLTAWADPPLGAMAFEALLGEVAAHTGSFVPRLLEALYPARAEARPAATHRAVAALVPGVFDLVVTTNFDECLEEASPTLAGPLVPAGGAFNPRGRRLLKVHGTASDPASLAATPEGLRTRTGDEWQGSLEAAIAGRSVLFVGYSFSDRADLAPVLARALDAPGTRYVRAFDPRHVPAGAPVASQLVANSIGTSRDLLIRLAEAEGAAVAEAVAPPSWRDQELRAHGAARRAARESGLSAAQRLAAVGALAFWLEVPRLPRRCFEAAAVAAGAPLDAALEARLLVRERRYARALRQFDAIIASGTLSPEQRIEALAGAGFCARAGGRRQTARRRYRDAIAAMHEAGLHAGSLDPYLADQLLRGVAEVEVDAALRARSGPGRERLLVSAEAKLAALERLPGLALRERPLLTVGRGRIAAARGDDEAAARLFASAADAMAMWGTRTPRPWWSGWPRSRSATPRGSRLSGCGRSRAASGRRPRRWPGSGWPSAPA
ncbi:MAG: SIR2 family protein [Chloroflexota bacterium]